MNNEETLTKMEKMKLYGMLKALNQSLETGMMVSFTRIYITKTGSKRCRGYPKIDSED